MAQVRLRCATVWYAAIVTSADRAVAPVFQVFAYSRILAIGDSGNGAALVAGRHGSGNGAAWFGRGVALVPGTAAIPA